MKFNAYWHSHFRKSLFATIGATLLYIPIPVMADTMEHSHHAVSGHHEHHAGGQHMDHSKHAQHTSELKRTTERYSPAQVRLRDQFGNKVSIDDLLGQDKPVLVNFIYTTCTAICPPMSATFSKVQADLGADAEKIVMISISIDPEHDSPDVLQAYAKRFKAKSQWIFLTGSLDDSIKVQQSFNAYHGDKMNHSPLTLFRASKKEQWIRYEGFADAADLVNETRAALLD